MTPCSRPSARPVRRKTSLLYFDVRERLALQYHDPLAGGVDEVLLVVAFAEFAVFLLLDPGLDIERNEPVVIRPRVDHILGDVEAERLRKPARAYEAVPLEGGVEDQGAVGLAGLAVALGEGLGDILGV